jgi:hypothetical protein
MNYFDQPESGSSLNSVNWSDPQLQTLLSKTEGWSLDNRGVFVPVACELQIGWGAGAVKSATLVSEGNGVMVIEARFIIPKGEQVRVDRLQAGTLRSAWGSVVDGREGYRAGDRANGIHIYWVHTR